MADFKNRWQELTAAARRVPPAPIELPPGFASRVLARARLGGEDSLENLWLRQSRHALAWAMALLAVCAALNYTGRPAPDGIRPHIETAVAAVISGL
jgi:hypothetical protein